MKKTIVLSLGFFSFSILAFCLCDSKIWLNDYSSLDRDSMVYSMEKVQL